MSGAPRFEDAKPIERVDDRAGLASRDFRACSRSRGAQLRTRNDPFDLEVNAPGTQRADPLFVAAKLRELRFAVRGGWRWSVRTFLVAHRLE